MSMYRKTVAIILSLALVLGLSVSVYASDNSERLCVSETVNTDDVTLDSMIHGYDIDVFETNNKVSMPNNDDTFTKEARSYTPDQFESNDSFTTSTNGRSGYLISANIHDDDDVDFYSFIVTDEDVNNGEYYSFILTNIPSGCNYDMLIVNDSWEGYIYNNSGTTTENAMFTFNTSGVYYVIIYSSDGCSSSNYALFYGRSIQSGSYGYVSTGINVNHGYIPIGSSTTTYTTYYSYDLTNNNSIPSTAFVTKFRMSMNGNGANYGGLVKQLFAENGTGYQTMGAIELFTMPERQHIVRQNWSIRAGVLYSYNYSWIPQVHITYDYIINPQTMFYAPLG